MRRNQYVKGNPQLRMTLVREAARLMYEEGIDQYYDAKLLAAKRILGQGRKGSNRIKPQDLPSNGEIAHELHTLAQFHEGDQLQARLFDMRLCALEVMNQLEAFYPRLIGSVSTGRIRKQSDIDLHVFCDHVDTVETQLNNLGLPFVRKEVLIRRNGQFLEYTHLYLLFEFPVEISVYPVVELRIRTRSSTDGKPIQRLTANRVLQILMEEHAEAWHRHLQKQNNAQ